MDYVLREIHEGSFRSHIEGHTLARKMLLAGYFWPTLDQDAKQFMKTWESC